MAVDELLQRLQCEDDVGWGSHGWRSPKEVNINTIQNTVAVLIRFLDSLVFAFRGISISLCPSSSSATLNGRSETTGDQLPVAGPPTPAAKRLRVGCSALFGRIPYRSDVAHRIIVSLYHSSKLRSGFCIDKCRYRIIGFFVEGVVASLAVVDEQNVAVSSNNIVGGAEAPSRSICFRMLGPISSDNASLLQAW